MIDLHAHSTISDGTASPKELVNLANQIGLSALALTDHDNIGGLDEAQKEADRTGLTLVKGIEFSVSYGDNRLIHILGLGIDPENDEFMKTYIRFRTLREERLEHVFDDLHKMGLDINRKDAEPFISGGFMDRHAVAKCIVSRGHAQRIYYAWINYLDKIPYIPGELISPKDAFSAIHAAGGKAVMAHFHLPIGLKGYTEAEARRRLKELKDFGLDGIEYHYPSYSEEDMLRCVGYIEEFDFIKSGGTDFHGENRPEIKLGIGRGDFKVPESILDFLM